MSKTHRGFLKSAGLKPWKWKLVIDPDMGEALVPRCWPSLLRCGSWGRLGVLQCQRHGWHTGQCGCRYFSHGGKLTLLRWKK